MVPLVSDRSPDAFLAALDAQKPHIVFTTPSHQFPTGAVMTISSLYLITSGTYEKMLEEAGVTQPGVSPLLLPQYARHER